MEKETTFPTKTKLRRMKMNYRRKLTRKLVMVVPVMVIASLVIALVAIPASAINQVLFQPNGGDLPNAPTPVPIPPMINYQGYLTNPDGNPINDTLGITFYIYEVALEGTPVWTETHPSVTVTDGLFNVLLGSINPINTGHLTGDSYLGVRVGTDPEMMPRQHIVSVAYALRSDEANDADALDGMDSADFVAVAGDTMTGQLILPENGLVAGTDQLVLTDGRVGIGTTSPSRTLDVAGTIYAESDTYIGVYGKSSSGNSGVLGEHSNGHWGALGSTSAGVYGFSPDGYGVVGQGVDGIGVLATSTDDYGVDGSSYSSSGVHGYNLSSKNYGRLGTGNEGVYGEHDGSGNYGRLGTNGEGVCGIHSDSGNYGRLGTGNDGVAGYSTTDIGSGVYGINTAAGYGVYGRNSGSGNYGYLGSSEEGVYGYGNYCGVDGYSVSGRGVNGGSLSGIGVYGYSNEGVAIYGIGNTWDFYAAHDNYGPFTGGHEVKLAGDFPQDIKPGMIVSVTGEVQVRTDEGEISYSSTLPTVQLADTTNDKKVFGVITSESPLPKDHWYQAGEGERFGIVNALGEGRVWVTNINGDIEAGDYITTSAIAGYGQKQDDDLLHSYTLGKAIETVDWSEVIEAIDFSGQTYKAYPIAVVYTSG